MMDHQPWPLRLVAFHDGEGSDAERAETARHVEGCSDCRRELEVMRDVISITHSPERLRVTSALVRRIRARSHETTWWQRRLGRWATPLRVALLVGVAIITGVLWWALRALPIVATVERLRTATGYLTIQDRRGVRDFPKEEPLRSGTFVITADQQYVTLAFGPQGRLTILPFALILLERPGPGSASACAVRFGRMYWQGRATHRMATPSGELTLWEGEAYLTVTPTETWLTAVKGRVAWKQGKASGVIEAGHHGRLVSGTGWVEASVTTSRKALVEAQLKRPLLMEHLIAVEGMKGREWRQAVIAFQNFNGFPSVRMGEMPAAHLRIPHWPGGFLWEEAWQEMLWSVGIRYEVEEFGVRLRKLTPSDRVAPLNIESLPLEYRELIRAYFQQISKKRQ